ncbi:MAG: TIGR03936 family radical SAM-associated protein [Thermoleophilia bacterium]
MNFNYQMRFSKTGRARFIAHLDTLSCLMRAIRRAGFEFAFTQGMRPKPVLSLAMPLGVGIEGEDEICDFSLQQRAPLTELAKKLGNELPQGMELKMLGPTFDRTKSASRVESVSYRIEFAGAPAGLSEAAGRYNEESAIILLRKRPKGDKEVDIKKYVREVELSPGEGGPQGITFDMAVTSEGTGRPDEIIMALSGICGEEIRISRIVRTAIDIKDEPSPSPARPGRHGHPAFRGKRR